MLEAGADPNAVGEPGQNCLFYQDDPTWVEYLLSRGANPHHRDRSGRTALHCTLTVGAMRVLAEAGISPNAVDDEGKTPLFRANVACIPYLLKAGADPSLVDHEGNTASERRRMTKEDEEGATLLANAMRDKFGQVMPEAQGTRDQGIRVGRL